jgi:hydrogenase maturation protease
MPGSVLVIGVGNALRGDDAAGLEVVRLIPEQMPIEVIAHEGEPIELLETWQRACAIVLVDTVRSGAAVGTIHRLDAGAAPVPAMLRRTSSHAIGIGEVIELARALGGLPGRVIVYGVEGAAFGAGAPLSPEVSSVLDSLAESVLQEARSFLR